MNGFVIIFGAFFAFLFGYVLFDELFFSLVFGIPNRLTKEEEKIIEEQLSQIVVAGKTEILTREGYFSRVRLLNPIFGNIFFKSNDKKLTIRIPNTSAFYYQIENLMMK